MLAVDLAQIEPGLRPFDEDRGCEEWSAGEAGRIDLFCRDVQGNPVVIELKRDNSSDVVAGQLARYMGYVSQHNLESGRRVRGIVVAHEINERLRLALKVIPNTEAVTYSVQIRLARPPKS